MPSVDNVQDIDPIVQYTASGGQTAFTYPFPIFEDDNLTVYDNDTLMALGTDYTVSGEGDDNGGNVTFLSGRTAGHIITIYRDVPIERTTDIAQNGPRRASDMNDELDRMTMWMQQLERNIGRAVRMSLRNDQPSSELELSPSSTWAERYLFVNSDGELEPAANLVTTTLSQSIIGGLLYPQTAAEASVGVTPTNYAYVEGVLERYGAVGDGVTSDSTALASAALVAAQGVELHGTPGKTYISISQITLSGPFKLNLHGATIKPSGDAALFRRDAPTPTATTTVSSGATMGSRTIVVASATGLAIGQWMSVSANDSPTHDADSYPYWWAKIDNLVGTTVTLDRPAPVTYAGTITLRAFAAALIFSRCEVRDGKLDGSATTFTSTTGTAFRIGGYEEVVFDNLTFKNFDFTGAFTADLQVFSCVDVTCTRLRWEGGIHDNSSNVLDIQGTRVGSVEDCIFDGSHFGFNLSQCEAAHAINNKLFGRRDKEAGSANSTRGIKFYGCASAIALGNYCSDYESPLKVQACFRYDLSHNHVRNAEPNLAYDGSIALNVASQSAVGTNQRASRVCDNTVENCRGIGIGIDSDFTGGVIVSGNIVRRCNGRGIYANVDNVTLIGNRVEDWGLRNSGDVGIHYAQGATVIGNRFTHATLTGLSCLRSFFQSTYRYHFEGNIAETANPLGVNFESAGTNSIASGTTNTGAITHSLSRTPTVQDITTTFGGNPTNDPGIVYLSAVGATTFQINVRADPGASGASISWTARIKQPFTA